MSLLFGDVKLEQRQLQVSTGSNNLTHDNNLESREENGGWGVGDSRAFFSTVNLEKSFLAQEGMDGQRGGNVRAGFPQKHPDAPSGGEWEYLYQRGDNRVPTQSVSQRKKSGTGEKIKGNASTLVLVLNQPLLLSLTLLLLRSPRALRPEENSFLTFFRRRLLEL